MKPALLSPRQYQAAPFNGHCSCPNSACGTWQHIGTCLLSSSRIHRGNSSGFHHCPLFYALYSTSQEIRERYYFPTNISVIWSWLAASASPQPPRWVLLFNVSLVGVCFILQSVIQFLSDKEYPAIAWWKLTPSFVSEWSWTYGLLNRKKKRLCRVFLVEIKTLNRSECQPRTNSADQAKGSLITQKHIQKPPNPNNNNKMFRTVFGS